MIQLHLTFTLFPYTTLFRSASTPEESGKKLPPLVIINGENSKVSDLKNIPKEDLEAVIVLNDPTYIINGVMYTEDRKSTRLNSSHVRISYAVFCLKKKK